MIFVAAFLIRIIFIFYFDTWHIPAAADHWSFGFEGGRIAAALAEGRGFSSPFHQPTGPTAWLAPGYPLLLSLIFRAFGVFTPASALVALILNALLSGATCVMVYRLGRDFFNEAAGLAGAVLFALNPAAVWHSITTIWDTSASALLLAILTGCLHRIQRDPSVKLALLTGSIAGLLGLINPACLLVYVLAVAWICLSKRKHHSLSQVATVLIIVPVLLCLPWIVRNSLVLDLAVIKSNFGTELHIGNNAGASANPIAATMDLHPTATEFEIYRNLGEARYVEWCRRQALTFIEENPREFVKLVARRIIIFWTGSEANDWTGNLKSGRSWSWAKRLTMSGWAGMALVGLIAGFRSGRQTLLLLAVTAYPIPYYVTHCTNRYRLPLEPLLAVLAANGVIYAWRKYRAKSNLLPGRKMGNIELPSCF